MNNIVRHSRADRILVCLEKTGSTLTLEIRDNGTGFAEKKLQGKNSRSSGLGLISMKERVELAGGAFFVESAGRQGHGGHCLLAGSAYRVTIPFSMARAVSPDTS